jgi:spermidine synthase
VFDAQVCWFDGIAGNNHIAYALNSAPRTRSRAVALLQRVRRRHGRGSGLLHRTVARLLVAWLARRKAGVVPQAI